MSQPKKQAQVKIEWAIAFGMRFAVLFVVGGTVAVIAFTLDTAKWQLLRRTFSPHSPHVDSRQHTGVVSLALQEVGTQFKPDLRDQAAAWVRHIFEQAGVQLKVSQQPLDNRLPTNPESANSLVGPDIGEIILNPAELKPGDIVSFSLSYDPDTVAGVGIYVGNGQIVDRQFGDGLMVERSLKSLPWARFFAGVRLQSPANIFSVDRLKSSDDVYRTVNHAVVTIYGSEIGSGSFVSSEGLVLTVNHVVQRDRLVSVKTTAGATYTGQVIAVDRLHDLALVQLTTSDRFPVVTLAGTAGIRVGLRVYAIGSPFGHSGAITVGSLTGITKRGDLQTSSGLLRPGNSGGPLLNPQGELIGVNKGLLDDDSGLATGVFVVRDFIEQKLSGETGLGACGVGQNWIQCNKPGH